MLGDSEHAGASSISGQRKQTFTTTLTYQDRVPSCIWYIIAFLLESDRRTLCYSHRSMRIPWESAETNARAHKCQRFHADFASSKNLRSDNNRLLTQHFAALHLPPLPSLWAPAPQVADSSRPRTDPTTPKAAQAHASLGTSSPP